MNRERAKELLPIIQAYAEGKDVQYAYEGRKWADCLRPEFDSPGNYRIKPEPREFWVCQWDDGEIYNHLYYSRREVEEQHDDDCSWGRAIKVREVIE